MWSLLLSIRTRSPCSAYRYSYTSARSKKVWTLQHKIRFLQGFLPAEHKQHKHSSIGQNSLVTLTPFTDRKVTIVAMTLSSHNLSTGRARELFKPSTDSGSLLLSILKILEVLDLSFCGWRHNGGRFTHFWPKLPGPGANLTSQFLGQICFGYQAIIRVFSPWSTF